jgi:predicted lipoprotein with Yx(FWY)xxD motif
MSVYFFTNDVKDSGKSACVDTCVTMWPAVTTSSATPSVEGVSGSVSTITTADGKKQVTVNGLPVNNFVNDKAPGDILGQGVKGVWYLVSPAGEMIKGAAPGY